jgi:hypothetical protein
MLVAVISVDMNIEWGQSLLSCISIISKQMLAHTSQAQGPVRLAGG